MIFALVKSGVVVNTILADQAFVDAHCGEYDAKVPIDSIPSSPGIGWLYNGTTFTAPAPVAPVVNLIADKQADVDFGNEIMLEFSILNDQRGLTDAQRLSLANSLAPIQNLLQVGDLQTVANILPTLPVDGVLLTTAIVTAFVGKLNAYLSG